MSQVIILRIFSLSKKYLGEKPRYIRFYWIQHQENKPNKEIELGLEYPGLLLFFSGKGKGKKFGL